MWDTKPVSKVLNSDASTSLLTPKLMWLMHIRYFIGVDIAKATLDWAVYDGQKMVLQTSTANSVLGIKTVLRLLKSLPGWQPQQAVFCMEHTGIVRHEVARFEYGSDPFG